ncbi:MAG: tetratricopeptide repeat protein [Deltaproteobacteria bacterium]|jgi:tetratricopeptide (TPR) repeat protein|nr:tetratricopeptide repeat protein [Deltaproteobacteria bacterium]
MSDKVRIKDLLREKDAFLSTSERLYNFYLTHTNKVLVTGLVLILAVVGVAAGVTINSARAEKASREYYLAYREGDPAATLRGMEEVRERWKSREAGRLAGFAMVEAYTSLGRYAEARTLLDELASRLRGHELDLAAIIYNFQGALAEETGDIGAALGHYGRAWEAAEAPVVGPDGRPVSDPVFSEATAGFRADILNSMARTAVALGREDEARQHYETLEARFPGTMRAMTAGFRIGAAGAPSALPSAAGSPREGSAATPADGGTSPSGAAAPSVGAGSDAGPGLSGGEAATEAEAAPGGATEAEASPGGATEAGSGILGD